MDNPEEILHSLEEFSKTKPKDIPRELDDYLCYVAKTGDPVFKWSLTKCLFREKLLKVITDFYESTLTIDLPPCPNVVQFHYENMKKSLLEKLDTFHGAPFTVQRISELLTNPRKEYNRADKFMRAIEKNILVVSTREPGKYSESDSENTEESIINGIPEPVNSPMETSFTCNDLAADPDSSSPSYDIVNSDSQDSNTYVKVDTDNLTQFSDSVKSDSTATETVCEETGSSDSDPLKSSNSSDEETLKDVNVGDKECESVICSTVPVQSDSDCSESDNSREETLEPSISYQLGGSKSDSEENSEETDSVKKDGDVTESIPSGGVCEKNDDALEETSEVVDVQIEESSSSTVAEDETASVKCISESNLSVEQVLEPETIDSVDNNSETKEESSEESQVVSDEIKSKPLAVECDTSSSCDSDLDSKQELPGNILPQEGDLGDGDIVTSCEYTSEDKDEVENELCVREASVIHATSTVEPEQEPEQSQPEPEPENEPKPEPGEEPDKEILQETGAIAEAMEVDECHISSVDELEQ